MRSRPALEGGEPVRGTLLPYARQIIDDRDVDAVTDVLRSDWLTTGPAVAEYERAFAQYVGAAHAVAVNSGTAALHAAVAATGAGPGDEVITSPISFAASANCALYCGTRPVFADIDRKTLNLDPASVAERITTRTRAVVAVDYSGMPADLDALREITGRHGILLIEDAAHALGARYNEAPVGAISQVTAFSTHPVKHITTGEGGMLTTNNEDVERQLRSFRNHGITVDAAERDRRGDWLYDIGQIGYNYRCPDILCALGLSQLTKLESWLARRREIVARYNAAFRALPQLESYECPPDRESAWHLYPLRVHLDLMQVDRATLFRAMRAEGIGVNVHYIPIYWFSAYARMGYSRGLCPVAEREYERLITLPLWAGMTDRDIEDVVHAVEKVIAWYRR